MLFFVIKHFSTKTEEKRRSWLVNAIKWSIFTYRKALHRSSNMWNVLVAYMTIIICNILLDIFTALKKLCFFCTYVSLILYLFTCRVVRTAFPMRLCPRLREYASLRKIENNTKTIFVLRERPINNQFMALCFCVYQLMNLQGKKYVGVVALTN